MPQCTRPGPRNRARKLLGLAQTLTEYRVYTALESFANDDGVCWPSQATLAEQSGLDIRKIRTGLAALRASGLVTSVQRYRNGALVGCTYTLTPYLPVATAPETTGTVEDAPQEPPAPVEPVAETVPVPVEVVRPAPAVPRQHAPSQHENPEDAAASRKLARMPLPIGPDELLPILRDLGAGSALRGFQAAEETLGRSLDGARSPRALLLYRLGDVAPWQPPAPRREWCGECDHGLVPLSDGTGRWTRCRCHPAYREPLAVIRAVDEHHEHVEVVRSGAARVREAMRRFQAADSERIPA